MNRSALFRAYNHARRAAREGRIDRARLNRALGLALRKANGKTYRTSLRGCDCRDAQLHPYVICKHRLALMLQKRAAEVDGPAVSE